MAAKQTNTQKYIENFCVFLEELINIQENSETRYYENTSIPGRKANFLAIKLGLTSLEGELPYDHNDWKHEILKKQKKPDRTRILKLKAWQKRAQALDPNKKCEVPKPKTNITTKKIKEYCDCLRMMIEILEASRQNPLLKDNSMLQVKGLRANKLALELGLIHPGWHLVEKVGLPLYDEQFTCIELKLETLSDELGISLDGDKPPLITCHSLFGGGFANIESLNKSLEKAEALATSLAGQGKQQAWKNDADAPEYIPNSEAIKLADDRISISKLGKLLKPNGTMRYMRKGRRCKVHIEDFRKYIKTIKTLGPDMFSEEAFDKFYEGVEARKQEIRHAKQFSV